MVVVDGHHYSGAQILIALDMRGHAYLVDDFRHLRLKVALPRERVGARPLRTAQLARGADPLDAVR